MLRQDNSNRYRQLRKKYLFLIYESYEIRVSEEYISIVFNFNLSDKFYFKPTYTIPCRNFFRNENLSVPILDNIVFHIGMIELISYWKAACPQKVIIKPYFLDANQVNWWKKVYFNGLREFFYLNSIPAMFDDFMEIEATGSDKPEKMSFDTEDSVIIPVGGGKDSVVTLELLKERGVDNRPLILNPRAATLDTIEVAGFSRDKIIEINRVIHPQLLELNNRGYLNGHTPFSALLAFNTLLAAILTGKKHIALSNESSANEATEPVTGVNHQYSKSYEFEKDFRWYVSKYITSDFNYFSFLRPLNEIQIGRFFSDFKQYHSIFRSCNAGSKTDIWCGKCPKCLFSYIVLAPFLAQQEMDTIFGKNLLNQSELIPLLRQMTGLDPVKPFECVGTVEEVDTVMNRLKNKYPEGEELPVLLRYYLDSTAVSNTKDNFSLLLGAFDPNHFLMPTFEKILNAALDG